MLINYLPNFLAEIEEFKAIMNGLQPNVNNLDEALDNILQNLFIQDADLQGIKRYENMLEIAPKLSESLETRRAFIFLQYNQTLPFTLENLILSLNSICGENKFKIFIEYTEFKFNIKIATDKKDLKELIFKFLDKVIPLNMDINIELDYNIWQHTNRNYWTDLIMFNWSDVMENDTIRKQSFE